MDLCESGGRGTARHPWEVARADFFVGLARDRVKSHEPVEWLDIGSGDAWLAEQVLDALPLGSSMTCLDINYTQVDLEALSESNSLIRHTANPPDGTFDILTMLDVIEHVEDDAAFLDETVQRHLTPGGTVIVSVPAYQSLFTSHDRDLGHYRRYTPRSFRDIVPSYLRVEQEGGLFTSLLPVRFAEKALELARGGKTGREDVGVGGWTGGAALTQAIAAALTLDWRVSRWSSRKGLTIPGLSYWAVIIDERT